MTDTTKGLILVEAIYTVCCILNYKKVILLSQCHNNIHIACNTCIMYHCNDLSFFCNQWFNLCDLHIRSLFT